MSFLLKNIKLYQKKVRDMFFVILICFSLPVSAQNLNFAFLTDLHVTPNSENEEALKKVVDEINAASFDFVVVTGDLTNTGANSELQAVKAALDKVNKPLLIIPGNHETNWSESAGLLFNQLWGNDRFVYQKNGFLLVGYNTGPFMKMGDGHVKQEDIQWLKRTLAENKGKTLISFSHYPIADGLDNWTDVAAILKENNCILSFCGHGHQFQLLNFDSIPGVMGRALKDKKGFGYNTVLINGNKVVVSERLLNSEFKPSEIAVDLSARDILSGKELSPKPDYSINRDSKVRVEFEYDDTVSIFSGPCIAGDTLVIYGNSTGWMKAIDIKEKTVRWQKKYVGAIYSTPIICADNIIFGTADGYIVGLNLANGSERWKINVGSPVLSEAVVEKHFVYIGGGDHAFYKINAEDGNIAWSFTSVDGPIQGKPALAGKSVIFGAWDTYLYCIDKNKGTLNWKWSNGKNQRLLSPGNIVPAISAKKVFIVAPDRYFTCLDLKTGKEIWRTNKHKVRESMGISPDGKHAYAKLMNDTIISVSTTSKEFLTEWTVDAGIGYDHNPCPLESANDLVIGATKNGLIVAINTYNKTVQWKYKLGNASINKLIFKNNKLWITSTEGKLMSLTLN